jgi:hypothetical protein
LCSFMMVPPISDYVRERREVACTLPSFPSPAPRVLGGDGKMSITSDAQRREG